MATGEAIKIRQNEFEPASRLRVTLAEITAVKRDFIERNLSFTLEEAGSLFGKTAKWALERVRDGVFIALDEFARKGDSGLQASKCILVTGESIEAYRKSIKIEPSRWVGSSN